MHNVRVNIDLYGFVTLRQFHGLNDVCLQMHTLKCNLKSGRL